MPYVRIYMTSGLDGEESHVDFEIDSDDPKEWHKIANEIAEQYYASDYTVVRM